MYCAGDCGLALAPAGLLTFRWFARAEAAIADGAIRTILERLARCLIQATHAHFSAGGNFFRDGLALGIGQSHQV